MDESLNDSFIPDEVQRCIHIALLCIEHYPNDRPTMLDIISMLRTKNALLTLPRKAVFFIERGISEETTVAKMCEAFVFDSVREISKKIVWQAQRITSRLVSSF